MKILKTIVLGIFALIVSIILFLLFAVLISVIQEGVFLPNDYIMWLFKSPFSSLIFIYQIFITYGVFYVIHKDFRESIKRGAKSGKSLIKIPKKVLISTFVIINIVIMYIIIFNVTVITSSKITDYTFLSPQGKDYSYEDIVKIETGIYGKKQYFLDRHVKGDFYYIIQLKDGAKIDLNEVGAFNEDEDYRFTIEKLDKQYVDMGIPKVASMDNFEYTTGQLDKIYMDKIRDIIENTK